MGILNKLFGKKEKGEKAVLEDLKKAKQIWEAYIVSFERKKDIVEGWNPELNQELDLRDRDYVKEGLKKLKHIEPLIFEELVDLKGEIKTQNEVIKDLERLSSREEVEKIRYKLRGFSSGDIEEASVNELMERLYEILITELHTIVMMKQNPETITAHWSNFRSLVSETEFKLLIGFNTWLKSETTDKVKKIIYKILLEKPLKLRKPKAKEPEGGITKVMEEEVLGVVTDISDKGELETLLAVMEDDAKLTELIGEFSPRYSKKELKKIIGIMRYINENEGLIDLIMRKAKED